MFQSFLNGIMMGPVASKQPHLILKSFFSQSKSIKIPLEEAKTSQFSVKHSNGLMILSLKKNLQALILGTFLKEFQKNPRHINHGLVFNRSIYYSRTMEAKSFGLLDGLSVLIQNLRDSTIARAEFTIHLDDL